MKGQLCGLCAIVGGLCAWPCHASEPCVEECAREGRCHWWAEAGECIAVSEKSCRSSERCLQEGRCSLDRSNGVCAPQSDGDCQISRACLDRGHCDLDASHGECVPGSDEDCRRSRDCRLFNACYLDARVGECDDGLDVGNATMAATGGAHAAAGIVGMALSPVVGIGTHDQRTMYAMIGLGAASLGLGLTFMIIGLQREPREGVAMEAAWTLSPAGMGLLLRF